MEPYLILHKVRTELAFDIAEKIQIGKEEGWIIPTSGHRAYPLWCCPLEHVDFLNGVHPMAVIENARETMHLYPDHYSANDKFRWNHASLKQSDLFEN